MKAIELIAFAEDIGMFPVLPLRNTANPRKRTDRA